MRTRPVKNAFVQARASQIWRNLMEDHKLDWAREFMTAFHELDDPKDRISALKVVADIFLPKPKPIEDDHDSTSETVGVTIDSRLALIKAMTEEQIKRECNNTLSPLSQLPQESSLPVSDTVSQKLVSQG